MSMDAEEKTLAAFIFAVVGAMLVALLSAISCDRADSRNQRRIACLEAGNTADECMKVIE